MYLKQENHLPDDTDLQCSWEKKPFENIVGKGENAGNQHFLLFPQCFLSYYCLKSTMCDKEIRRYFFQKNRFETYNMTFGLYYGLEKLHLACLAVYV